MQRDTRAGAEHHALDGVRQQIAVAQQCLAGEMHVGGAADRGLDHSGERADACDVLVDQNVLRRVTDGLVVGIAGTAVGLDDLARRVALHDRVVDVARR